MNKKIKYLLMSVGVMIAIVAFSIYIDTVKTEKVVIVEKVKNSSDQVLINKLNEDIVNLKGEVETLKMNNMPKIVSQFNQYDNTKALVNIFNSEKVQNEISNSRVSKIVVLVFSIFASLLILTGALLDANKNIIIFSIMTIVIIPISIFSFSISPSKDITPDVYELYVKNLVVKHNENEISMPRINYSSSLESQLLENAQFKEDSNVCILKDKEADYIVDALAIIFCFYVILTLPVFILRF